MSVHEGVDNHVAADSCGGIPDADADADADAE